MPAFPIKLPVLAVSLALSVSLAACGSSATSSTHSATSSAAASSAASSTPAPAGGSAAAHSASVAISGYAYHPVSITVAKGAKVTFTNKDQTAHTATSTQAGTFDTGTLNSGASKTVTLTKPGTYSYYCQFHAFMKATVTVK